MPVPQPPAEKIRAAVEAYRANGSNAARTAEAIGVAASTLKEWLKIARKNGLLETPAPPTPPEPIILPEPSSQKPRIYACRPTGTPIRITVIGDAHDAPEIPKDRFRWIGRHIAETKRERVVQIGDFFDLNSLNSHIPDETFGGRLKGTFLDDIASGEEALTEFDKGLDGYPVEKDETFGNHEHRAWRAEEQAPHVAGMMQLELTRLLERHGWRWHRYGEFLFLNGVGFVHVPLNRLGRPYGGKTAANQIANDTTFDLFYGHEHTEQQRKAPKIGPQNYVRVVNVGCALPYGMILDYAKISTTGWSWGIMDATIQDGHIQETSFVSMLELERRYS